MTTHDKEDTDDHPQIQTANQDAANSSQCLGKEDHHEEKLGINDGDIQDMPIRVYNEDKETEVGGDEEEVVYPRRGSTEELSASISSRDGLKNESASPLIDFEGAQETVQVHELEDSNQAPVIKVSEGELHTQESHDHSPALIDLNTPEDLGKPRDLNVHENDQVNSAQTFLNGNEERHDGNTIHESYEEEYVQAPHMNGTQAGAKTNESSLGDSSMPEGAEEVHEEGDLNTQEIGLEDAKVEAEFTSGVPTVRVDAEANEGTMGNSLVAERVEEVNEEESLDTQRIGVEGAKVEAGSAPSAPTEQAAAANETRLGEISMPERADEVNEEEDLDTQEIDLGDARLKSESTFCAPVEQEEDVDITPAKVISPTVEGCSAQLAKEGVSSSETPAVSAEDAIEPTTPNAENRLSEREDSITHPEECQEKEGSPRVREEGSAEPISKEEKEDVKEPGALEGMRNDTNVETGPTAEVNTKGSDNETVVTEVVAKNLDNRVEDPVSLEDTDPRKIDLDGSSDITETTRESKTLETAAGPVVVPKEDIVSHENISERTADLGETDEQGQEDDPLDDIEDNQGVNLVRPTDVSEAVHGSQEEASNQDAGLIAVEAAKRSYENADAFDVPGDSQQSSKDMTEHESIQKLEDKANVGMADTSSDAPGPLRDGGDLVAPEVPEQVSTQDLGSPETASENRAELLSQDNIVKREVEPELAIEEAAEESKEVSGKAENEQTPILKDCSAITMEVLENEHPGMEDVRDHAPAPPDSQGNVALTSERAIPLEAEVGSVSKPEEDSQVPMKVVQEYNEAFVHEETGLGDSEAVQRVGSKADDNKVESPSRSADSSENHSEAKIIENSEQSEAGEAGLADSIPGPAVAESLVKQIEAKDGIDDVRVITQEQGKIGLASQPQPFISEAIPTEEQAHMTVDGLSNETEELQGQQTQTRANQEAQFTTVFPLEPQSSVASKDTQEPEHTETVSKIEEEADASAQATRNNDIAVLEQPEGSQMDDIYEEQDKAVVDEQEVKADVEESLNKASNDENKESGELIKVVEPLTEEEDVHSKSDQGQSDTGEPAISQDVADAITPQESDVPSFTDEPKVDAAPEPEQVAAPVLAAMDGVQKYEMQQEDETTVPNAGQEPVDLVAEVSKQATYSLTEVEDCSKLAEKPQMASGETSLISDYKLQQPNVPKVLSEPEVETTLASGAVEIQNEIKESKGDNVQDVSRLPEETSDKEATRQPISLENAEREAGDPSIPTINHMVEPSVLASPSNSALVATATEDERPSPAPVHIDSNGPLFVTGAEVLSGSSEDEFGRSTTASEDANTHVLTSDLPPLIEEDKKETQPGDFQQSKFTEPTGSPSFENEEEKSNREEDAGVDSFAPGVLMPEDKSTDPDPAPEVSLKDPVTYVSDVPPINITVVPATPGIKEEALVQSPEEDIVENEDEAPSDKGVLIPEDKTTDPDPALEASPKDSVTYVADVPPIDIAVVPATPGDKEAALVRSPEEDIVENEDEAPSDKGVLIPEDKTTDPDPTLEASPKDPATYVADVPPMDITVVPATPGDKEEVALIQSPEEDVAEGEDEVPLDQGVDPVTPKARPQTQLIHDLNLSDLDAPIDNETPLNPEPREELIDIDATSVIPEVPMTPRSDLGINSPTFDSRSEVSTASRQPVPPESPRIDPLQSIEAVQLPQRLVESDLTPISARSSEKESSFDENLPDENTDKSEAAQLPSLEFTPVVEQPDLGTEESSNGVEVSTETRDLQYAEFPGGSVEVIHKATEAEIMDQEQAEYIPLAQSAVFGHQNGVGTPFGNNLEDTDTELPHGESLEKVEDEVPEGSMEFPGPEVTKSNLHIEEKGDVPEVFTSPTKTTVRLPLDHSIPSGSDKDLLSESQAEEERSNIPNTTDDMVLGALALHKVDVRDLEGAPEELSKSGEGHTELASLKPAHDIPEPDTSSASAPKNDSALEATPTKQEQVPDISADMDAQESQSNLLTADMQSQETATNDETVTEIIDQDEQGDLKQQVVFESLKEETSKTLNASRPASLPSQTESYSPDVILSGEAEVMRDYHELSNVPGVSHTSYLVSEIQKVAVAAPEVSKTWCVSPLNRDNGLSGGQETAAYVTAEYSIQESKRENDEERRREIEEKVPQISAPVLNQEVLSIPKSSDDAQAEVIRMPEFLMQTEIPSAADIAQAEDHPGIKHEEPQVAITESKQVDEELLSAEKQEETEGEETRIEQPSVLVPEKMDTHAGVLTPECKEAAVDVTLTPEVVTQIEVSLTSSDTAQIENHPGTEHEEPRIVTVVESKQVAEELLSEDKQEVTEREDSQIEQPPVHILEKMDTYDITPESKDVAADVTQAREFVAQTGISLASDIAQVEGRPGIEHGEPRIVTVAESNQVNEELISTGRQEVAVREESQVEQLSVHVPEKMDTHTGTIAPEIKGVVAEIIQAPEFVTQIEIPSASDIVRTEDRPGIEHEEAPTVAVSEGKQVDGELLSSDKQEAAERDESQAEHPSVHVPEKMDTQIGTMAPEIKGVVAEVTQTPEVVTQIEKPPTSDSAQIEDHPRIERVEPRVVTTAENKQADNELLSEDRQEETDRVETLTEQSFVHITEIFTGAMTSESKGVIEDVTASVIPPTKLTTDYSEQPLVQDSGRKEAANLQADSTPSEKDSASSKRVQFPMSFPTIQEPVDEGSLDAENDQNLLDVPKARVRHFSTASHILPGGWAFPLQTEGQASLEMASGEFVPPPPRSPKEKSNKCIIM